MLIKTYNITDKNFFKLTIKQGVFSCKIYLNEYTLRHLYRQKYLFKHTRINTFLLLLMHGNFTWYTGN
jgi:hypothetical protein